MRPLFFRILKNRELATAGETVLTTTATRIYRPEAAPAAHEPVYFPPAPTGSSPWRAWRRSAGRWGNSGDTLLIFFGSRFLIFEFSIQKQFQFFNKSIRTHRPPGSFVFSKYRYFRLLNIEGQKFFPGRIYHFKQWSCTYEQVILAF
jgi:hypothetical protein